MAGRETEEELLGRCRGGDDDDRHQIALMLNEVYRKELWDRFEPRLRRFARALVRRHRSKIEALARALIERPKMSNKQVRLAAGLPPRFRTDVALALFAAVPDRANEPPQRPYSCRLYDNEQKKCALGSCDHRTVDPLKRDGGRP